MKSKYIGLWLILAVSLCLLTVVAFVDDIYLFGLKVKKAPIEENLIGAYKTTEEIQQEEMAVQLQAEKKQQAQTNPVDTTPKIFLVFGDSMTQNIALRLAAYAGQNGHEIHTVNWDSSGTRIWSGSDTLTYFIDKYKPDYIFVSLGGNEAGYGNPETLSGNVRKILDMIGGIPFVWIGPPSLKNGASDKYSDMLGATLPAGTFFRSDGLTLERRGDKIHPTKAAAAFQVDSLARWIRGSAHPIRMDFPADSLADTKLKDTNIVYLKPVH